MVFKIDFEKERYYINGEHLIKNMYAYNEDGIKYELLLNKEIITIKSKTEFELDAFNKETPKLIEKIVNTPLIAKEKKNSIKPLRINYFLLDNIEFHNNFFSNSNTHQYNTTTKELFIFVGRGIKEYSKFPTNKKYFTEHDLHPEFLDDNGKIFKVSRTNFIEFNLTTFSESINEKTNEIELIKKNKCYLPITSFKPFKTPEQLLEEANIYLINSKKKIKLNPLLKDAPDNTLYTLLTNPCIKINIISLAKQEHFKKVKELKVLKMLEGKKQENEEFNEGDDFNEPEN